MNLRVITPTLGKSPWLTQTVASVAACAPGAEHVLVAPADQVPALQRIFPDVRVLPDGPGGMYAALNVGLAADGTWDAFTYINDDDVLLPAFAEVTAALQRDVRVGLAYGGVRLIDGDGRRLGAIPISPQPALNRALYALRLEPVYQHGTLLTRAAVDRIGGFDATLRLCGDSELLARACVRGITMACATRREVAAFRLRRGQLTKQRAAMAEERRRVDVALGLTRPSGFGAGDLAWARWRFRLANARIYAERIARHGPVSFDTLLARLG